MDMVVAGFSGQAIANQGTASDCVVYDPTHSLEVPLISHAGTVGGQLFPSLISLQSLFHSKILDSCLKSGAIPVVLPLRPWHGTPGVPSAGFLAHCMMRSLFFLSSLIFFPLTELPPGPRQATLPKDKRRDTQHDTGDLSLATLCAMSEVVNDRSAIAPPSHFCLSSPFNSCFMLKNQTKPHFSADKDSVQ